MFYDYIVIGGGFYGCGIAAGLSGRVLVLEKTVVPGSDWALGFDPGKWDVTLVEPAAREFADSMRAHKALDEEGRACVAAFAPLMAEWCINHGIDIDFSCDVLSFTDSSVDAVGVEGPVRYRAGHVIDARPVVMNGRKYATGIVLSDVEIPDGACGEFFVTGSSVAGEYYLSLPVSADTDWEEARNAFHRAWDSRPDVMKGALLQLIGTDFSYSNAPNPAAAIEYGLLFGREYSLKKYDVIVVGFGNAGMTAAVSAGRQGARVLVLEKCSYPGGTLTGGGVDGFYGRHPYGLIAELQDRKNVYKREHCCSSLEAWKITLENEVRRTGGSIVYNASVSEVLMDGKHIYGLRWRADGIECKAEANVVIDATADARICELAGCDCTLGRQLDQRCNTFTTSMLTMLKDNVFVTNFDAGRINQYSRKGYRDTVLAGLLDHIKESFDFPQDKPHYIAAADVSGLREGKHIVAEHTLTLEDFFAGRLDDCDDLVGYAHSNIDIHANDMPLEDTVFQDWMIGASMWGTNVWFPITRSSLVPRGYKGLLAAGRHFGCDHNYGQAVRMGDHMGRIGEAAGVIAALAVDGDVIGVSMSEIKSRMVEMPDPRGHNLSFTSLSDGEIYEGLISDKPGFAIWSARCRGLQDKLRGWFAEAPEGSKLKCNSAFALALLDDTEAVPELLRLAECRDGYAPETSRKYNHKRGYAAVYLLGRLAVKEAVPILLEIIGDRDMEDKYEYHTHAIAALVKIANANPEVKDVVKKGLDELAADKNWSIEARLKGTQRYVPVDSVFREYIRNLKM